MRTPREEAELLLAAYELGRQRGIEGEREQQRIDRERQRREMEREIRREMAESR